MLGFEMYKLRFCRICTSSCKNRCVKQYFGEIGLNGYGILSRMLHRIGIPVFWLLNWNNSNKY